MPAVSEKQRKEPVLQRPFREAHARDLGRVSLVEERRAHGYVLIRESLPLADVERVLREMVGVVDRAGWLLAGHVPMERIADAGKACGDPDPAFKELYKRVFGLEAFHALAHHPRLLEAMRRFTGPHLLVHPKLVCRLIFPHCERLQVHAHQDHTAVAGDAESFTAWLPLHDCPEELGPLQILEGSHRFGLQAHDPETGYVAKESARGGEWVSGRINAGDVLIFHSLTVHAASANVSKELRISMDFRFQDYGRVVDPGALVFPSNSSTSRTWKETYSGWRSEELQYYWTRLPLRFKPSRKELAELARTADSERMRVRYGRILQLIEEQLPDR